MEVEASAVPFGTFRLITGLRERR